ncbi:histidine kinase [Streptosporangium sp. NPDC051023]|uniref:sensor histidine kinase n=1 Tax=Streptosporangium sp. NPDC051023 TaxID=3155410 RepID=UPI00344BC82C
MRRIRFPSRGEVFGDLPLWAALCLPVLLVPPVPVWWEPALPSTRLLVAAAGVAVLGVAVPMSRRAPLAAVLLALAAGSWSVGEGLATSDLWPGHLVKVGPVSGFTLAIVVLAYLAGRRSARSMPAAWALAATLTAGTAAILASPHGRGQDAAIWRIWIPALSGVLLFAVLPWAAGRLVRQRAEQRSRERSLVASQARLRERNRIAQDMHDSLGHDLALIALRAGALEVAPDLTERHRRAAGELRLAAAETTERLREIIGVLGEGEHAPLVPPLESVAEVVGRARESGVRVELRGEESLRDRTACRVVQEALTNATKHAPASPVTVEVLGTATGVTVTVTNPVTNPVPGTQQGRRHGGPGLGLGLAGLHERVRLAGGTFEAGGEGGGFRVVARLPRKS